ncbi:MAG: hypothetical protein KIS74_00765 [Burkholderiales bacterium]|nr:hypothetical protein [Burkholderiales bacterium]
MTIRKPFTSLVAFAVGLGSPLASMADIVWITTNDEAGTRIIITDDGSATRRVADADAKALKPGDLSPERQYVFLGEEVGWQLRPMEYRYENGRLVHVDDPVGHMERLADTRPLTEQERKALALSGGG